jgi:hypothetical protein
MTSNSLFLSFVGKVFLAVALLIGTYAALPSPAFAANTVIDTTFQGNYATPTFTALTSIPGVQEAANSRSLAILLNNLYRICIGAAAVIAVLKIVQGGITYMLGDSVTEKKEAKHHITMAVLGLVFILSPYLVFNVIDPRILKLDVDVSGLAPGPVAPTVGGTAPSTREGDRLTTPDQVAACTATPNCRAITVQANPPYQECSCGARIGSDSGTPAPGGFIFNRGVGKTFSFSPSDFVFIATTIYDLGTTDRRACYAPWGGAFPTLAACQQKKASVEQAHGSETGYTVISDCAHVTVQIDVNGACVPPNSPQVIGDLGRI